MVDYCWVGYKRSMWILKFSFLQLLISWEYMYVYFTPLKNQVSIKDSIAYNYFYGNINNYVNNRMLNLRENFRFVPSREKSATSRYTR